VSSQRKRELDEAETTAETPIGSDSFGHQMLLKMGWGGTGTGLRQDGISEPVKRQGDAVRREAWLGCGRRGRGWRRRWRWRRRRNATAAAATHGLSSLNRGRREGCQAGTKQGFGRG
jgi:hypothetical protein